MTFQDYLNQPDPQHQPAGSVLIEPSEVSHAWPCGKNYKDPYTGKTHPIWEVELNINGSLFDYQLNPKSLVLWVMDGDGNPIKESVFKLTEWP